MSENTKNVLLTGACLIMCAIMAYAIITGGAPAVAQVLGGL